MFKYIDRSNTTTYKKINKSTSSSNTNYSTYNYYSKMSDPKMCVYCTVCKQTVDEMSKCYVDGICFPKNSKVVSVSKNICSKCRSAIGR